MNLLHIAHFDRKFIIAASDIFEKYSGAENLFIVFSRDVPTATKFFQGRKNFRVVPVSYFDSAHLDRDLETCDCLVIHYLDGIKSNAILRAPRDLPIVWSGWGADYCDLLPDGGNKLLGKQTRLLMNQLNSWKKITWKKLFRNLLNVARAIRWAILWAPRIKRAIKRVNFFSSPFVDDYENLKKYFWKEGCAPIYTPIYYGGVAQTYAPGGETVCGPDILVGNAAFETNNHLEVFALLSKLNLSGRKIVVPLSYGDPDYRDAIIRHGKSVWGNQFVPLTEFLSLEKYNSLIASCEIVMMGQRRQQGGGNTLTMLYKGAKVFLDEQNPVFHFLRRSGACVYSLQELEATPSLFDSSLSKEEIQRNRDVLEKYAGEKTVRMGVQDFINKIQKHLNQQSNGL